MKPSTVSICVALLLPCGCSSTQHARSAAALGNGSVAPSLAAINQALEAPGPPHPSVAPRTLFLPADYTLVAIDGKLALERVDPAARSNRMSLDAQRPPSVEEREESLLRRLNAELERAQASADHSAQLEAMAIERAYQLDALASQIEDNAQHLSALLSAEKLRAGEARTRAEEPQDVTR